MLHVDDLYSWLLRLMSLMNYGGWLDWFLIGGIVVRLISLYGLWIGSGCLYGRNGMFLL